MVFTCVVCTIKEPPLLPLRTEHRQLLEVIVSPVLDTTELKDHQWLHCVDCKVLLKSVHSFQQTALKGIQAFKCLLNKHDGVTVTGLSGGVTGIKPMLEAKPEILMIKSESSQDPETDRQLTSVTQSKEINPLSEVHIKSEPGTTPQPDSDWDYESTRSCYSPDKLLAPNKESGSAGSVHLGETSGSQKILKQTVPCNVPDASNFNNYIRVFTIKKPTPRTQTNAVIKIKPQTPQQVQSARTAQSVKVLSAKSAVLANVQSANNLQSAKTAQSVNVQPAKQAPLANVQSAKNVQSVNPPVLSAKTVESVKVFSGKQAPLANIQSANNLLSAKTAQSAKPVQSENALLSAKTVQSPNALLSAKTVQIQNVQSTNNLLPANIQAATNVQSANIDPATTQSVKVPKTKEEVAANAAKVVLPENRFEESELAKYMPWEERESGTKRRYNRKRASCPHCNLSLSSKGALRFHISRKHSVPSPVDCKTCGKTYSNQTTLYSHMTKHKQENKNFDPELYCKQCCRSFSVPSAYRKHLLTLKHTPREQYAFECETCKKRFPNERRLQDHIDVVHLRKKMHKCDLCDKSFGWQFALRNHVALAHERRPRSRAHVCHRCGKAFTAEKTLKDHLLAHEGLRPFHCKLCPATFSYSSALYTHNRLKHLRWKGKKKDAAGEEKQAKDVESGTEKDTESEKVEKESDAAEKQSEKVRKVTKKVRKVSKKVRKQLKKVEKGSEKLDKEMDVVETVSKQVEKESEQVERELKQMENELKLLEQADSMDIDLFFNETL